MERQFETVEPNVWKPEEDGDLIEGTLVSKREKVGPNESKTYYLEKGGKQIMAWGSTVLDNRMDFVDLNDYVKITYKGKRKNSKGQDTKIFKVEREQKEVIEATEEKVEG